MALVWTVDSTYPELWLTHIRSRESVHTLSAGRRLPFRRTTRLKRESHVVDREFPVKASMAYPSYSR
jgi:hypothetical protein